MYIFNHPLVPGSFAWRGVKTGVKDCLIPVTECPTGCPSWVCKPGVQYKLLEKYSPTDRGVYL